MNRREFLKAALATMLGAVLIRTNIAKAVGATTKPTAPSDSAATEPGCIIQWLSQARAIMVTDLGDVFSTINGGVTWHESEVVHVALPGDADADPWDRLMSWNNQYDMYDLRSMVARAEVIHEPA